MTITHALPAAQYHAIRAVSAGMVATFDSACAARAFAASPWNAARVAENANHFDIGTAAHLAVLEPSDLASRIVTHGFDDYRTKEARDIRNQAWRDGLVPLKPAEWAQIQDIAGAIYANINVAALFKGGNAEVTMQWEWSGLPCKLRADYIPDDLSYVVDLKTCDSANPEAVQRAIYNFGYHVRAAWYLAGVEAATGKRPGRYLFVLIEKKPVGMVTVYELDDRALSRGNQIIAATLPKIAKCIETGIWPGYKGGVIGLPQWSEFKYADREEAGEFQ